MHCCRDSTVILRRIKCTVTVIPWWKVTLWSHLKPPVLRAFGGYVPSAAKDAYAVATATLSMTMSAPCWHLKSYIASADNVVFMRRWSQGRSYIARGVACHSNSISNSIGSCVTLTWQYALWNFLNSSMLIRTFVSSSKIKLIDMMPSMISNSYPSETNWCS